MLLHSLGPIHLLKLMNHNKLWTLLKLPNQYLPIMLATKESKLIMQQRLMPRSLRSQYLTFPRDYHASGLQELDLVLGVCVTILSTFNQGHWSKLICHLDPLLQDHIAMAQYLLQGQALKLGFLLGLHTWGYLAQEPLLLFEASIEETRVKDPMH